MNSINIIGVLRKNIDELYRNFEYELPYSEDPLKPNPIIAVKQWTNMPNSRLVTVAEGTRVAIHGHLDYEERFGTILIVEQFQSIR